MSVALTIFFSKSKQIFVVFFLNNFDQTPRSKVTKYHDSKDLIFSMYIVEEKKFKVQSSRSIAGGLNNSELTDHH